MKVRYFLSKNSPPLHTVTPTVPNGTICMYQFEGQSAHVNVYYEGFWQEAIEELYQYMRTRSLIEGFMN